MKSQDQGITVLELREIIAEQSRAQGQARRSLDVIQIEIAKLRVAALLGEEIGLELNELRLRRADLLEEIETAPLVTKELNDLLEALLKDSRAQMDEEARQVQWRRYQDAVKQIMEKGRATETLWQEAWCNGIRVGRRDELNRLNAALDLFDRKSTPGSTLKFSFTHDPPPDWVRPQN